MSEPPTPSEPQDLVSLVRSADSPRELRLFAARGLLPLERDDRMRALLAVVDGSDPDVDAPARETLAKTPPDDLGRFLEEADPTPLEIDVICRHTDDSFVLEKAIRHRSTSDETLLRLAGTVAGAPQDALIVNQVRLLRQPALVGALLGNPNLTVDGRRRLAELTEEFFEKQARRREQERLRLEEERRRAKAEAEGIVFEEEPGEGLSETPDTQEELPSAGGFEDPANANLAAVFRRISVMTPKEKVDLAQKGTKEERRILIGDVNRMVSMAVLKCEALTPAEVETFCAMRHLHTEIFRDIADTREWVKRPKIQFALVTNPAVPLNITLPLVKFLNMRDLRNIARDRNLPEGVRTTARKILLDKRGG